MQQIDRSEHRLSAALARIAVAADRLATLAATPPVAPDPGSAAEAEIARLRRQLDEAQAGLADMAERGAVLRERHAATVATLEARIASLRAQTDGQAVEAQRLRTVNMQLREALQGLREALTGGVADAGQINRALEAELTALRAARLAEAAELDTLLGALEPLVAGAETARGAQREAGGDDAGA